MLEIELDMRGRGRPKKTWTRVIESDMSLLGLDENMALKMPEWTAKIHKLEKDIEKMSKRVKHHEDGITMLKTRESHWDESILEMQDILREYYLSIVASKKGADNVSDEEIEKHENDIGNMKKIVKHHEDRITMLKTSEIGLDESIHEMQDILANYYCSVIDSNEGAKIVPDEQSEKETIEQILMHKNSAAALYYNLKTQQPEITQPATLILKDRDAAGRFAA